MPRTQDTGTGQGAATRPLVIREVCGQGKPTSTDAKSDRYRRRSVSARIAARDALAAKGMDPDRTAPAGFHLPAVCSCGCTRSMADAQIADIETGAYISNTINCGAVWVCPVCSAKIRTRRAAQVAEVVDAAQARGYGAYLVTVTVRHQHGDDLKTMLDGLADSWRSITASRAWKDWRDEHGVVGYVRTLEITYGANGFHPHYHFLLVVDHAASSVEGDDMRELVSARWTAEVARRGLRLPDDEHGVRVDACGADFRKAGAYCSKVMSDTTNGAVMELTMGDLKSGRMGSITPFQLLDIDDPWARAAWREYVRATKGKRSVYTSRGLRDKLGIADDEQTDEEIANEEVGGEVVAVVKYSLYAQVRRESPELIPYALQAIHKGDFWRAARILGGVLGADDDGLIVIVDDRDMTARRVA